MALLDWIDDNNLETSVEKLLTVSKKAILASNDDSKLYRNVVDPFSAVFQMGGFDLTSDDWLKNEKTRQAQKTLQNHVGEFHQNILGCVDGWNNLGAGNIVDLRSDTRKIIAEVKNKHNTVTGGNLKDVYDNLAGEVMPKSSKYNGYTAYFVTVIPKKAVRFNYPFTPSDKTTGTKKPSNEQIRSIDGASFYQLVTGSQTALKDLFEVLPTVINSLLAVEQLNSKDRVLLNDLFSRAFS